MTSGGGRGVAALTGAICAIAVVIYASNVPRDPVSLLIAPSASGQPTAARPATPAEPPAPQVDLSVVVWPRGAGHGRRAWSITCPPMRSACRTAIQRSGVLATEGHGPCAPMRARTPEAFISGYVNGRYVTAWLDQRDGCGLSRWRKLQGLLRRPAAPVVATPPVAPTTTNPA